MRVWAVERRMPRGKWKFYNSHTARTSAKHEQLLCEQTLNYLYADWRVVEYVRKSSES